MNAKNPVAPGPLRVLCALAALAAGCASDDERFETADFGNAVRETIALQTANPGSTGTGLDGVKAAAVMEAYRKDVAKPQKVDQELMIRVGQ